MADKRVPYGLPYDVWNRMNNFEKNNFLKMTQKYLSKGKKSTPEQVMKWLTEVNYLVYLTSTSKSRKRTKKYLH